ncbi:hypothetical protein C7974DRAFT_316023, partial [Boeremia exigua]|uniref:uncharacterized protein n=1 Tax=Boeremia exigua TaxID=749465 RepID=UPI001E8ECAEA
DDTQIRSSDALPRAHQSLSYLQAQRIPFILLTNGGGKHESERVAELSRKLHVPLDTSMFVQSHTPFADMDHYKDKTVMVVGGAEDKCRQVAEAYGFKTVVTPGDILAAYPDVWPFSQQLLSYYKTFTRPLPAPIDPTSPSTSLRIDAIFVYNDPRDWGLDAQIIKDVLLSERGILGTLSPKNGNVALPNKGYQQDGQPALYFSNPDLLWAAKYHLPRLGQGGFREAFEGIWAAITGGEREGVSLQKIVMGKPYRPTYEFAEKRLMAHRRHLVQAEHSQLGVLKRVYMVGDNPASDIAGGNNYESPFGTDWASILVSTGVYAEGSQPAVQPRQIVGDVWDAVRARTLESSKPKGRTSNRMPLDIASLALALLPRSILSTRVALQAFTILFSYRVLHFPCRARISAKSTTDRRGGTATLIVTERLPAGTPTFNGRQPHKRNQIVVRAADQPAASVNCNPPQPHFVRDPAVLPADLLHPIDRMAYHPRKDNQFDDDQSERDIISLVGMAKLRLDRRKENKTWRPVQAGSDEETPSVHDELSNPGFYLTGTEHAQKEDHLDAAHDGARVATTLTTSVLANSMGGEMRHTGARTHVQLFGNLPDLIRLSEQTGEFDGQVVFIGHPNRDISAHQWSSSSFQWVNIGRYSTSRGKVEGSLASDRLRGIDEPQDTLEYFKLAAENRQTLVVEHGRQKEASTAAEQGLHGGVDVVSTQPYRDAQTDRGSSQTQGGSKPSIPSASRSPFTRPALEDPFVTTTSCSFSQSSDGNKPQSNWLSLTGSLDLTYRFPSKTTTEGVSANSSDTIKSTESSTPKLSSGTALPDVTFGELAVNQRGGGGSFQHLRANVAYQRLQGRKQHLANIEEAQSSVPEHNSLTSGAGVLGTAVQHAGSTRSAAPARFMTSALNAAAAPYMKAPSATVVKSGTTEYNTSTINSAAVALHHSDLDGLRTAQQHEVANGLNQQTPTPQSFKGPFFTETKPTTHDPTVALAIRVSEEEKLANWFRDGHRPARQKEYTKSLIAAAAANDKTRHFGTIGRPAVEEERGPHANTAPFVRLYENLSEYVEEYRNGSGQSYFTRRWKPAAQQLRDLGPDGNTSYFGNRRVYARWPMAPIYRPAGRSIWG